MANKGDVDLVIRAKNEASKAIDAVSKALDDLAKKQNDAGASAGKSGNLLDQFAKTVGVVATAYDRLKSDADRAAQAFARQEANLNESKAAYAALTAQLEAAQRVQQRMASFVGPMPKGSEKQTQIVAKAVADLQSQADKLSRSINVQQDSLTKSFYALEEITGGAGKAAEALNRVQQAHKQAADAAAADAAAQLQAAQATQRAAEAAQQAAQRTTANAARRSALETRRDLAGALGTAQSGQQTAQSQIKTLADTISGQKDGATSDQIAQMSKLTTYAGAYKQAVRELTVAVELYNRVLRDGSATTEQIAAAQNRAKAALSGASNLMQQAAVANRQAASAQRDKTDATRKEEEANQKLDNALQSLFANSRRSLSLYQRWRGEVLSLISSYVGLMAAIQGVNQVIQASMQMQATESRLNVVTGGDPAQTAQEMRWLLQEADRLGFSLNELGSEWSKFAVAAQASNFSMGEARKIFLSVAGAGRVLKLDTQSMSQTFVALTQMMSKGTIQMEELRQQLGEHIPGAFSMMAKAAGVSSSELVKMMEKGQLTSDYLLKFADVLDDKFGPQLQNSLKMTQAEVGRFQTALTVALNEIADAGVIDAFTEALRKLQAMLKSDDAHVWFQRIGSAVGGVIKFLMAILDNLDLIMAAFAALGAAKGVAYVITLTQALIRMVTAIRTAATAGAALNLTLAGLGGPIGIAIGVLAGAFAYLTTRVSESEKAMTQAQRATDDLVASYQMGDKSAKNMADAAANMSALQIERTRGTLQKKLQDELSGLGADLNTTIYTEFGQAIELPMDPKIKPIKDLVDAVKSGQVPLSEFKKRLDEIAKANPDLKELALQLQDQAEEAIKTDAAYRKFEASIRLMKGTATDADKTLLGIKTSLQESGDAAATAARNMDRYKQAMDNIAKSIPELKKQLDLQAEIDGIQRSFQAAVAAAAGDTKLIDQAKDRMLQAIAAVKRAYDESLIRQFSSDRGDSMLESVNLLKNFEGFTGTAKWDVNAYRAGYGSDTVTLSDGTIQKITQGMTVSETDAMRDLVRRIGEFQDTVKNQIGADRFNAFTAPQQAALTSIAYNYGSLPKDIVQAIKYGTNEMIAQAVRNRSGDNGGINAGRRNREADILAGPSPALAALQQKAVDARQDRVTKVLEDLSLSLKEAGLSERDKFIEEALKRAQPRDVNEPRLTAEQEASVRQQAGQTFDAKQALLVQQKIVELQNQLAESKAGTNRQDFIAIEAQKQKIDLATAEGQKWAELQGQIWDRANAEKQVNDLMALRQQLIERFTVQQNAGDATGAALTSTALEGVNRQLEEATQKAIAFWQSMGADNPQAQAAIAALQNTQDKIGQTGKLTLDAKTINQDFTSGAVQGFNSIAESMAGWIDGTKSGKEVLGDIRNAFLKFAADFLRQIANMILQQVIFNMVAGMFGGGAGGAASGAGGLGGAIAGLVKHNGGMVGEGGHTRSVSAGLFANAVRYHTGGIAGLQPGEVPAILQRGEEVLAKNDPRNIVNGGGGGGKSAAPKIVNVLDPSLVQDHLNSSAGEDVLVNVIRRNGAAIKQILSEA
jgi:tape measure domain-containing protein